MSETRKTPSPIADIRPNVAELEYFTIPDARVIGKGMRCSCDPGAPNLIPAFWDKCLGEGIKDVTDALPRLIPAMLGFTDDYDAKTNTFLYIISVLCPAGTPVPEGFVSRDIPACVVSKGRYGEWLDACKPVWARDGWQWNDGAGQCWNAELYLDGESTDGFRLLCAVK